MEFRPKSSGLTSGVIMVLIGLAIIVGTTIWFLSQSYFTKYYMQILLSTPYFPLYLIGFASTVLGIYQHFSRKRMTLVINSDSIDYVGGLSRFDKSVFFKDLISIDTVRYDKGLLTIIRWKCSIPDCPGCSADRIVITPEFEDYRGVVSYLIKNVPQSIIGEGAKRFVSGQEIENAATSKEEEFQEVVTKLKESLIYRLMMILNILSVPIAVIRLINKNWLTGISDFLLLLYGMNMLVAIICFFLLQREHLKIGNRARKTYSSFTNKVVLSSLASGFLIIYSMIFNGK